MAAQHRVHYITSKDDGYDHEVLRGVLKYARRHAQWAVTRSSAVTGASAEPGRLADWYAGRQSHGCLDGVLFRGSDLIGRHPLLQRSRAVVETQMRTDPPPFPCVSPDYHQAGRMAAEHFLHLGFRHFAACISSAKSYQRQRWEGFRGRLLEAGYQPSLLDISVRPAPVRGLRSRAEQLAVWLRRQPGPLGLMFAWVPGDSRLADACEQAGLRIPHDVAVVGIGGDLISSELSWPTLTTVEFNLVEVGFQSAALLHRLMSGEKSAPRVTLLPPLGIRARMSTDVAAVEDETVAAALRMIRENCPHPLPVETLARAVGVGRRTLEMKFQSALQCSPAREMRRQRIEFAKAVLRSSSDKLLAVAVQCGYQNYGDFIKGFREVEGISPAEYRDKLR